MKIVTVLKDDFKKEESINLDRENALENKIEHLDNIVYKRDQSTQTVHMLKKQKFFYDHSTKQALGPQNPFYLKKAQQLEPKIYDGNVIPNTYTIEILDSEETLMLAEESHFNKRFIPQTELSAEQAFWSQNSVNSSAPCPSSTPNKVKVPKELPKVSMVNTSLKKLKHHLAGFDKVVKERTTATTITEGMWGFEHTKACFRDEIIPFVKTLKDIFNNFDQYLIDELTEVQTIFIQMEQAVEQHCLESKTFEVKMNQVLNENDRLLEQVINKDTVTIVMNSSLDNASMNVHECKKCLELETELLHKKIFIEKETYDKLFRSYTALEKHCISLEVKDTVIKNLKERIKSLSENVNTDKVKKDLEEIETINIELDHMVSKLVAENEHLKQTYKQLYDSIKPTHIRSKEQSLKDDLRKLKGKHLAHNDVPKHTIDPKMLKIDVQPISPNLLNNMTIHSDYLRHTQEQATILREVVEQGKSLNLLNTSLDIALAVTLKNKDKRVGFTAPVTSSGNTNIKIASSSNLISNKPVLSSTVVKSSTSASGSQPSGNTKKYKTTDPVWKPTGKVFTLVRVHLLKEKRNACPLTRITTTAEVPPTKPSSIETDAPKPVVTLVYLRKPRKSKTTDHVSKPKVIKFVSTNKKEPSKSWGSTVSDVLSSSLDDCRSSKLFSVKFRNDHVAKIMGYGDYQIRNVTISRVYYVEGLRHNLFSVGQLCDSNLEVAFRQHTCFIRNLEGDDLLTGSRGNNLYTLSIRDMISSSPISRHGLVRGLPKLKFEKDHLCFAYAMGKSKKKPHKPKSEDTNQEKLYLLHMDLCGPMCVASVNGKKQLSDESEQIMELKAVATTCYTQNRSILRLGHGKTPYELLHDKLPNLSFLHVFGTLCYPTNDSENLGKLQLNVDIGIFNGYAPTKKAFRIYSRLTRRIIEIIHVDFDELTAMASEHSSSGPALHEMTPAIISSGLIPNPPPSTPFVPPSRTD
ncbi:retrovirus-related pol polyprotein from transposon TNT 1-94 [Tanacetum coccineum]